MEPSRNPYSILTMQLSRARHFALSGNPPQRSYERDLQVTL